MLLLYYPLKPLADYPQSDIVRERYAGDGVAWNFAWLSFPWLDDPDAVWTPARERQARDLDRLLAIDDTLRPDPPFRFAEVMWQGVAAPEFVEYVARHPGLATLPWYRRHSDDWLMTLRERAALSEHGRTPSDRVVVVNFRNGETPP